MKNVNVKKAVISSIPPRKKGDAFYKHIEKEVKKQAILDIIEIHNEMRISYNKVSKVVETLIRGHRS